MKPVNSLAQSVGNYLARTRQTLSLTYDQVAQAGRLYGARWSASSVRNLELGQASLTLSTVIVLALALGRLRGKPIAVTDLFSGSEQLSITEGELGLEVSPEWLTHALGTNPITVDLKLKSDFDTSPDTDETPWARAQRLVDLRNKHLINGREVPRELADEVFRALDDARKEPPPPVTLAEKRAAGRASITPRQLQRYSLKLWGRPLEDEAAIRAGEGSVPQARGRVTRMLVEEIKQAVADDAARS